MLSVIMLNVTYKPFMLSVIMRWVFLCWMSLCWVSWRRFNYFVQGGQLYWSFPISKTSLCNKRRREWGWLKEKRIEKYLRFKVPWHPLSDSCLWWLPVRHVVNINIFLSKLNITTCSEQNKSICYKTFNKHYNIGNDINSRNIFYKFN